MLLKIERFQFILSICFCQTGMFTAWSGRKHRGINEISGVNY